MTYLNTTNIARSTAEVEYHPLIPFLPENAATKETVVRGFLLPQLHQRPLEN